MGRLLDSWGLLAGSRPKIACSARLGLDSVGFFAGFWGFSGGFLVGLVGFSGWGVFCWVWWVSVDGFLMGFAGIWGFRGVFGGFQWGLGVFWWRQLGFGGFGEGG